MRHALTVIAALCAALAALPARADGTTAEGYELYLLGEFDRAGEVFRRAAEGGDPAAQYMLGSLYALGQGVPHDPAEAHRWLSLAAARGDPLARRVLPGLGRARATPDPPPPVAAARAGRTAVPAAEAAAPTRPVVVAAEPAAAPDPPAARHAAASEESPPDAGPPAPAPDPPAAAPPRYVRASHPAATAPASGRPPSPFEAPARGPTAIASDPTLDPPPPGGSGPRLAALDLDPDPSPTAGREAAASPALVAGVQRRLAALGYAPGQADGVAGARTRIAIRDFQRDTGLVIDGLPSPALDAALAAAAGADGLVALVQDRLGRLGFPAGPADGVLRAATRRAMFDYYRTAGVAGVLALDELARRLDADLASAPAPPPPPPAADSGPPAPRTLAEWLARTPDDGAPTATADP